MIAGISGAVTALADTLFPATSLRSSLLRDFSSSTPALLRFRLLHPAVAALAACYVLWLIFRSSSGRNRFSQPVVGFIRPSLPAGRYWHDECTPTRPWAKVVNTIGYQRSMVVGLLCMAVGAFLFVPAASSASFPLFLGALIVLAAGITGLQVAANPYVVVLGKPETASSRLDLPQAFNSLGTAIAPKLGGLLILTAVPLTIEETKALSPPALHLYRVQEAASVKMPYIVIGIALLLLAALISTSKLPTIATAAKERGEKVNDSVWKHPNLIFGALGIFAYVGAEVSIGSFLVNYFGQADIAALSAKTAGYVSFYWGGAMVGRFLGAGLLRRIKTGHLLAIFAVCTSLLVTLSMLTHGHFAMWTILAVGFFNSIMFPSIFSLGVAELGPLTGNGSGILNMAIVDVRFSPLYNTGSDCRPNWDSPRVLCARDLLLVHLVLRAERFEAKQ